MSKIFPGDWRCKKDDRDHPVQKQFAQRSAQQGRALIINFLGVIVRRFVRLMRTNSQPAKVGSDLIASSVTGLSSFFSGFKSTTAMRSSSALGSGYGSEMICAMPMIARSSPV